MTINPAPTEGDRLKITAENIGVFDPVNPSRMHPTVFLHNGDPVIYLKPAPAVSGHEDWHFVTAVVDGLSVIAPVHESMIDHLRPEQDDDGNVLHYATCADPDCGWTDPHGDTSASAAAMASVQHAEKAHGDNAEADEVTAP